MAHADKSRFKRAYVAFRLEIPDGLIQTVNDEDLPDDWRERPASLGARRLGDTWLREGRSVVLDVPSVIVPVERNYLLNPQHEAFGEITIGKPQSFRFDDRL